MFKKAIVRKPGNSLVAGIGPGNLGEVNFEVALKQHADYVSALQQAGLTVTVLEAQEQYPDSCFVEDAAILTKNVAIITNPGAPSRKGEEETVSQALESFYNNIHVIDAPGTIEGGDVMMVGDYFYVGLSARTNSLGAEQFLRILRGFGYDGAIVRLKEMLHLKTGLAYLESNNLLVAGELVDNPIFKDFNRIIIPADEGYAANCIWINDYVLVPSGYPKTKRVITTLGYQVLEVDTSEFRKLDGGLSCLSLRF